MIRGNQYNTMSNSDYYNIHQMAAAGDVLEDFVVIFRDMMSRVCKQILLSLFGVVNYFFFGGHTVLLFSQ